MKFYVKPPYVDISFTAFRNANEQNVAWTRFEFGKRANAAITGSIEAGSELTIQRYVDAKKWKDENKDAVESEGNVKVTLYGTYTDEDNAEKVSTIYMVPLKVSGGKYVIPGTNTETLIAKVEKVSGNFSVADVKIPVTVTTTSNSSIWPGLENTELFVASNVMTNQQLIDKSATDAAVNVATMITNKELPAGAVNTTAGAFHGARTANDINIYRTSATVDEDLYIMTDPAKYKGFRIDKAAITKGADGKGAYINEGWYYMLLKKYPAAAGAPAHVVWLDDASEETITGILEVKQDAKQNANGNNAIYNLQGIRVNGAQKGIYIQNGKKYVVK